MRGVADLGDPDGLGGVAIAGHQLAELFEVINKRLNLGRGGIAIGMDIHDVEMIFAAGLIDALDVLEGNLRQAAEQDRQLRINPFDFLISRLEQDRVFGRAGVLTPELLEVRLVPDLPVAETVLVAGDDRADIAPPVVKMLDDRPGPGGVVIENRQDGDLRFDGQLHRLVEAGEIEGGTFGPLDAGPVEVRSGPANAGLVHPCELPGRDFVVIAAGDMGADAVGGNLGLGRNRKSNNHDPCR